MRLFFVTLGSSSFRALTCAAQFEMCIFSELALAYFPSITIMWCAHIFVGSLSGQFETSAERRVCTPAIPLELALAHTCTHCAPLLLGHWYEIMALYNVKSILTEISPSRQDRRVLQKSKIIRIKFLSQWSMLQTSIYV